MRSNVLIWKKMKNGENVRDHKMLKKMGSNVPSGKIEKWGKCARSIKNETCLFRRFFQKFEKCENCARSIKNETCLGKRFFKKNCKMR